MSKAKVKKSVKKCVKNKKTLRVLIVSLTIICIIAVVGLLVAIDQGVIAIDDIKDYINQLIGKEINPPIINDPIIDNGDKDSIWSENVLLIGDELSGSTLNIHFIDVGQGDSILIEFPDGKTMLIDGGDTTNAARDAIIYYLERQQVETIDYMILTHPHADHVGALDDVLALYPVKAIYMPNLIASYGMEGAQTVPQSYSTRAYYNFYELVFIETYLDGEIEAQASVIYNEGIIIISGNDYIFTMYCPGPKYYENINYRSSGALINNMSPICVLEFGERTIIFTGDAEQVAENRFIEYVIEPIDADILKVGHHGSDTSSSELFLEFISVEYAVIMTDGIKHNHPRQSAIDRLLASGVEYIFRTDLHSDINISIDQYGNMRFQVVNYINYENTIIGH